MLAEFVVTIKISVAFGEYVCLDLVCYTTIFVWNWNCEF